MTRRTDASAAFILYDTHFAESPNDAAIERLVKATAEFMIQRAQRKHLSATDVICATQELMARFLVAPAIGCDRETTEKMIVEMMGIATRRAINMLDGVSPGAEPEAN